MASLREFFSISKEHPPKGVAQKNNLIKRSIIASMASAGECTITDLSKELNISIPTITKLVAELVDAGIATDHGKIETAGGRRPNTFGLADRALYFIGIEIKHDRVINVLTDLENNVVASQTTAGFNLTDREESLDHIISETEKFISGSGFDRNDIMGAGVSIPGRVDPEQGKSYRYFSNLNEPLQDMFSKRLDMPVAIENDTRALCFAEYRSGRLGDAKEILYVNLGYGMAVSIVIDGKLYKGKSGFAGEFGHTPFFDNNVICSCGKRGCLETEVSGYAIENKMRAMIENGVNTVIRDEYEQSGTIHIDNIIEAAKKDDTLSIELIEEAAEKAGKSIAFLLNIFNPELVVIGGNLAQAGDYLMLPLQAATNKYSVNLVYSDTKFMLSKTDNNAGAIGAAMIIRDKIIGLS